MSTRQKQPQAVSKGVKIARNNRSACNFLTHEQRDALTTEAMRLIYGGKALAGRA